MDTLTREQRSSNMAAVRSKNTRPELLVRHVLYGLGYRYRLHGKELPGRPDIVFRKRKSVIFVNGCFWHGHDCPRGNRPTSNVEFWQQKIRKNCDRDHQACHELGRTGWRVLTIWECETKDQTKLECTLSRFLGPSSSPIGTGTRHPR